MQARERERHSRDISNINYYNLSHFTNISFTQIPHAEGDESSHHQPWSRFDFFSTPIPELKRLTGLSLCDSTGGRGAETTRCELSLCVMKFVDVHIQFWQGHLKCPAAYVFLPSPCIQNSERVLLVVVLRNYSQEQMREERDCVTLRQVLSRGSLWQKVVTKIRSKPVTFAHFFPGTSQKIKVFLFFFSFSFHRSVAVDPHGLRSSSSEESEEVDKHNRISWEL